jgi:hypothetical protein
VNEGYGKGIVYSETVVHSAPAAFAHDAPYQVAIVKLESGGRVTVRIRGERAAIGDRVEFVAREGGIPYFRRID